MLTSVSQVTSYNRWHVYRHFAHSTAQDFLQQQGNHHRNGWILGANTASHLVSANKHSPSNCTRLLYCCRLLKHGRGRPTREALHRWTEHRDHREGPGAVLQQIWKDCRRCELGHCWPFYFLFVPLDEMLKMALKMQCNVRFIIIIFLYNCPSGKVKVVHSRCDSENLRYCQLKYQLSQFLMDLELH